MRWSSRIPTEHQEQVTVMQWAHAMYLIFPEACLMFAIANGGLRPQRLTEKKGELRQYSPEGKKLRAEGVKAGVPDLLLPVARHGYHGLFIEMKRQGGSMSHEQASWFGFLTAQGYAVCVCRGADAAIKTISEYLSKENQWCANEK